MNYFDMPTMSHRHSAVVTSLLEQFSHMLVMDHINIPHIHQYIYTASMATPMVLLRRPTNSNTLPMTGINSSLYIIFNIDTISVGVTPPLGHLELNVKS